MSRFAQLVSSSGSLLFLLGLPVVACGGADSSQSSETGTTRQPLLCESAGLHAESCSEPIPPIHIFPRPKLVKNLSCTSSATCWVWSRAGGGWDPSYPDHIWPDPNFVQEMTDAACGEELYFADDELDHVPTSNQDHFEVGHVALCGSVPVGAKAVAPFPAECGCSPIPTGYTLVYWTSHPASPLGTCSMASCFESGEPPPAKGLPGEPLPDQQD